MLEHISISNFKGFKDLSIEGFGRVNIICGANNIGKTSILEAINALNSMNRQNTFRILTQGLITRSLGQINNNNIEAMKNLFYGFEFASKINVRSNEKELSISYNAIKDPSYDSTIVSDMDNGQSIMRGPDRSISVEIRNMVNNDVARTEIYDTTGKITPSENMFYTPLCAFVTDSTQIRRGADIVPQHIELSELIKINMENDVVISALKIFNPGFNAIAIAFNQIVVGHNDYSLKMPLATFGTGMQRVLNIIMSIMNSPEGIVLVDEIENGIHYFIMPKVWEVIFKLAKQYNCQLFITTHSEEFMKYVMSDEKIWDENKQDFRCITLNNENNVIVSSVRVGSKFENAMEFNVEVRG